MNIWQFRKLGKLSFLRSLAKVTFSIIYWDSRTISIKRGPLKNYSWVCNKAHQFWMPLGLYETQTATILGKYLQKGMTFIDIGANAGYFVLLGSKCVGENGKVVAFEPVTLNIKSINANISINKLENVIVEGAVLSDKEGMVSFTVEANNANSHISEMNITHAVSKELEVIMVKSMKLDDYVLNQNIHVDVIKMDVEGAEVSVLRGSINTLKTHKPVCVVSTHSKECFDGCVKVFEQCGYKIEKIGGFEHELLCYPM